MSAYEPLAAWYDALTQDVDYAAFADFYERVFAADGGEMHTLRHRHAHVSARSTRI